jgi:hypothetical protein
MSMCAISSPQVLQPAAVCPFAIGDPGRAALELPAGVPGDRPGHADVELSVATLPGMLIQAATCRGLQHRAAGTRRQDAFAIARQCGADGISRAVAVVCDGVGSFGRSDEAAMLVSSHLASSGGQGMPWPDAFACANEAVRAAAELALDTGAADPAADGMATTAVGVSVHLDAGEWAGEVAWVGDSTLWHLSPDGQWALLSGTPGDDIETDYHSTGVTPMPSPDGTCESREFRVYAGAIFVMSDGVANPLKWSDAVKANLAEWWKRPPDPFTFAAQVSFARRSHMDDRTVIGIWPNAAEESQGEAGHP